MLVHVYLFTNIKRLLLCFCYRLKYLDMIDEQQFWDLGYEITLSSPACSHGIFIRRYKEFLVLPQQFVPCFGTCWKVNENALLVLFLNICFLDCFSSEVTQRKGYVMLFSRPMKKRIESGHGVLSS